MTVLLETKNRLEERILKIKSIVWWPSPYIDMLNLRKKTIDFCKSKTNDEMILPENMRVLSDAVEEEKKIQKRIEEQKDCSNLIDELVKKEMELRDINMEIWRENRDNS